MLWLGLEWVLEGGEGWQLLGWTCTMVVVGTLGGLMGWSCFPSSLSCFQEVRLAMNRDFFPPSLQSRVSPGPREELA